MATTIRQSLGLSRSIVDLKISGLLSYHDQVSSTLNHEVREFEKQIKEFPAPDDDDEGQYDSFIDDYLSLRDDFPKFCGPQY